jgi:hypothetical protein
LIPPNDAYEPNTAPILTSRRVSPRLSVASSPAEASNCRAGCLVPADDAAVAEEGLGERLLIPVRIVMLGE